MDLEPEVQHDHVESGDSEMNAVSTYPLEGNLVLRLESEDGDCSATFTREHWAALSAAAATQMGWN